MRSRTAGTGAALAWLAHPGTLLSLVLLPAAAIVVAACSPPYHPYAASVAEWRGMVVAGEGNGGEGNGDDGVNDAWVWQRASRDGGRTWQFLPPADQEAVADAVRPDPEPDLGCVPERPTHCYRVVPGHLRVEETRDGGFSWTTSWEVSDEDRERLARRYDGIGDPTAQLASRALVVDAIGATGQYVVVVANGRDGYAVRDVSGHWERIGFGADTYPYFSEPPPVGGGGRWLPYEPLWGLVGAVLSLATAAELLRRRRAPSWRWLDKAGLVVVGVGLVMSFAGLSWQGANERYGTPVAVLGGLATLGGLALWLALLAAGRVLAGRQWLVLAPTAVLTGTFLTLLLVSGYEPLAGSALSAIAAVLVWVAGTVAGTTLAWALDDRAGVGNDQTVRRNLLA